MQRTKWTERSFSFDFPIGILPGILERLIGTTPRLRSMTANFPDRLASTRNNGKWSIKEQIGHLLDLEDLHIRRLEELAEHRPELTPADMQNKQTENANHNDDSIESLINQFEAKRNTFVNLLKAMNDETLGFAATHTRLGITMRPVDVAYFTAEHDDHHLASIREILDIN